MAITAAQQRALSNLARAANRRLERASEGQRAYLERQISKYHTRQRSGGATVFKQGKAASESEYRARMRELERFMSAQTSKITGWKEVKKAQVKAAGETLRGEGYDLTDEELAAILEELDEGHSSAAFYSALANVEISKSSAGANWQPDKETISAAINERRSAQQRTEQLLKIRQWRKGG